MALTQSEYQRAALASTLPANLGDLISGRVQGVSLEQMNARIDAALAARR